MRDFFETTYDLHPSQRLGLLKDLLNCGDTICFWVYSQDLQLVRSDSPFPVQNTIFAYAGCLQYMKAHFKNNISPVILSSDLGLMWGAAPSEDFSPDSGSGNYIVIGPVLSAPLSREMLHKATRELEIDLSWRNGFIHMMQSIPIVSPQIFFQYVLMLYYCATGKKTDKNSIAFQENEHTKEDDQEKDIDARIPYDRSATYRIEQQILDNIRTGNLNYAATLDRAHQLSNGIRVSGSTPLEQAVISTTTFTSLCVRAAIEGGLSPDTAYSVGDGYIQTIIRCKTFTDLRSINHAMYDDFVRRVHRHRHGAKYSAPVQSSMEYIELHIESALTLEGLSKRLGYTTYYLSHKFKEETGIPMKNYIKNLRLEKAKILLLTTDHSIAGIAEMLHFCSSSYFSSEFCKKEGCLPQEFRKKQQRI